MRRKQKKIQENYWSKKGFDSSKEFFIYQFLCEHLKSRTKIRKIDNALLFYRHKPWREHIESILNNYDSNDLEEFYHFVRLQRRKWDTDLGMQTSMFVPLTVAITAAILTECITTLLRINVSNVFEIILLIIAIIVIDIITTIAMVFIFNIVLNPFIKSKNQIHFWTDCMEIVEDQLKIIKTTEYNF